MKVTEIITEAANPAQQAAIAISMKKAGKKPKNESTELEEEFDLIESIIERLAEHNGVDAEVIWEDLETLTEDELYAFAVTSEPIMEEHDYDQAINQRMDSYKQQVAYNEKMADKNPPIDLGLRAVGEWAKVGAYGNPIKSAWLNIAKYGVRNNRFNNSVDKVMTAIGSFPDLEDEVYDMYDINQNEVDILYNAYETVHDQWEQTQGVAEGAALKQAKRKYNQAAKDANTDQVGAGKKIDTMKKSLRQKDLGKEQGMTESEAWQKANNRDKTDGMSRKAVKTYRREHPGSKLQTAVTTKPSKLKKGSKASKRRKSYCSRSRGQMKMHNISCAKTPDKAICKARRRWNC
jgi:hypothetical protein